MRRLFIQIRPRNHVLRTRRIFVFLTFSLTLLIVGRRYVSWFENPSSQFDNVEVSGQTRPPKQLIVTEASRLHSVKRTISRQKIVFQPPSKTTVNFGKVKRNQKTKNKTEIINRVIDWFTIEDEMQKDKLLNLHGYEYLLNSRLCANKSDILIIVHSATTNIINRQRIRKSWGSVKQYNNVSMSTVFMLGQSQDLSVNENLTKESSKYGDIVQGNFLDSYNNLTYKHVMALHWVTTNCRNVTTLVKADDDVVINIYKLSEFSQNVGHIHNTLYCTGVGGYKEPLRITTSKYYIPYNVYPFDYYPISCSGLAYILSLDEAEKLVRASETTRFFWIDDIYVTGLLARRAGIQHVPTINNFRFLRKVIQRKRVRKMDFIFYYGRGNAKLQKIKWDTMWDIINASVKGV